LNEESGEEDCVDLELELDDDGRIAGIDYDKLDFSPRTCDNILGDEVLEAARQECIRLHAIDESTEILDASFWFLATESPRCLLEAIAQVVFESHTDGIVFDPANSGAEWWFQVKETQGTKTSRGTVEGAAATAGDKKCPHDYSAGEEIPFHFDKDEVLAACSGLYIYPQLSTVTYLTDEGGATLVCPLTRAADGHLDAVDEKGSDKERDLAAPWLIVSHPVEGKHLVFDGRHLHGVPDSLKRLPVTGGGEGNPRITLLVNVWLNHSPFGIERFPLSDVAPVTAMPRSDDESCPTSTPEEWKSKKWKAAMVASVRQASLYHEGIKTIGSINKKFSAETTEKVYLLRDLEELILRVPQMPIEVEATVSRLSSKNSPSCSAEPASTFNLGFETGCGARLECRPMSDTTEAYERRDESAVDESSGDGDDKEDASCDGTNPPKDRSKRKRHD